MILILLTNGCTKTVYIKPNCPTIDPVAKIERLKLQTDANSQLTQESSYNAILMIEQHQIKEKYNDDEIERLRIKVIKLKEK